MENLPKHVPAFEQLLNLEKIEQKDLAILSPKEKDEFLNLVHRKAWELNGRQLDIFIEKTASLLDNDFIWEINHHRIMDAVRDFSLHYHRIPTKAEIALYTGLSRKTVSKHYDELTSNPALEDAKDTVRLMTSSFMVQALRLAEKGDLKAIKLCLDYTRDTKGAGGSVNNQNNFIQINKTVINQQVLQQLKPEQLKQIEEIVGGNKDVREE